MKKTYVLTLSKDIDLRIHYEKSVASKIIESLKHFSDLEKSGKNRDNLNNKKLMLLFFLNEILKMASSGEKLLEKETSRIIILKG